MKQRLGKYGDSPLLQQHWDSLCQEWKTISKSTATGSHFSMWAQSTPEVGPLPWPLPTRDQIHDIEQIFRFQVDNAVYQDGQIRRRRIQMRAKTDHAWGHSRSAFAIARGPSHPPLTQIQEKIEDCGLQIGASQLQTNGASRVEIAVDAPSSFQFGFPIKVGLKSGKLIDTTDHTVIVEFDDAFQDSPDPIDMEQFVRHIDHAKIVEQLNHYWQPFWQRDDPSEQASQEDLAAFQQLVELVPAIPDLENPEANLQLWMQAIGETKTRAAPGIDGIRASELQLLPEVVIQALITVIEKCESVLPQDLLVGRTLAMPKHKGVCNPKEVRPITILPQIYRTWANITTKKMLKSLAVKLPAQVSGFLPGRSALSAGYQLQLWLESRAKEERARSGATLDLVK